jgi:hypothetical protein
MSSKRRPLFRLKGKESVHDGDGVTPPLSPPPPSPPPPPPMPNMAQFWANAAQFMMSLMAAMPRQGEHHETIGHTLANLFNHNPSMFDVGT